MQSDSLYEIELKSLLSQEKYESLRIILPKRMKLLNCETLRTRKFKSQRGDDVRLRHSENRCELVYKKGQATDIVREEITLNLGSKEDIDSLGIILDVLNFVEDPPWTTQRMDFEHFFEGYVYSVSLQDTENFAQILEVEFVSNNESERNIHEAKIKQIMSELGCEPIDLKEFSNKIEKYVEENKE